MYSIQREVDELYQNAVTEIGKAWGRGWRRGFGEGIAVGLALVLLVWALTK